ncbi:uncharacterized mitochondrial protein-like protein, partial [Tanacetum coccineum]
LPPKEKDPRSFILPCVIGNTTVSNALADLGASISVMPFSMFKRLCLGNPKPINMMIEMADSIEDDKVPIILGRPMLATAHAKIEVFEKKIYLEVRTEQEALTSDLEAKSYERSDFEIDDLWDDLDPGILTRDNDQTKPKFFGTGNTFVEKGLTKVLFGKPFKDITRLEEDLKGGVIWFEIGNDKTIFNMPRAERRFKKLTTKQHSMMPPILKTSNEDMAKGISQPYQKIRGFYKGCLELGHEYKQDQEMIDWIRNGGATNEYDGVLASERSKAVVSAVVGNGENAVKSSSCWIWRPTGNVIDHKSKDSGSYMLKRFDYVDLQGTGTQNYQEIDGGFVAFGESPKRGKITGKDPLGKFDEKADEGQVTAGIQIIGMQSSEDAVADDAGKKSNKEPVNKAELDNFLVHQKQVYANRNNKVSTASPSISAAGQSFDNANNFPTDPLMLYLEDTTDLLNTSIFSGAYDDEDVGAEADLNNLETLMNVSPIPTTKIHKDHPKEQIIGDPVSVPQIRRMTKSAQEHAMMDVKSAFLYGTIEEEVYVCQPPGFEDPQFPDKVYK